MTITKICLISAACLLTACASKPEVKIVSQKAPLFCEYPHESPALPDVPSLDIQEVRDFANLRQLAYCGLYKQYQECLRLATRGATEIPDSEACHYD